MYFGKRYYAPMLGRWISADPLAVHVPGRADLNVYAYVHGMPLAAVDPVGLEILTAIAVGFVVGSVVNVGVQYASNGRVNWGGVLAAGIAGSAAGAFSGGMISLGAAEATTQGFSSGGGTVGAAALAEPSGTTVAVGGLLGSSTYTVPAGVSIGVIAAGWKGKGFGDTAHFAARGAEAGALTSAGAALGFGTASYAGAGTTLSWAAAGSAALNATFTGARGVYDWGSPAGYLAFGSDSTWGLVGTSLGNAVNLTNIASGASYDSSTSTRQNRQVYTDGFALNGDYAFTQGNVVSNLHHGKGGASSQSLLDHETLHITQSRCFGPSFQISYLGFAVGLGAMGLLGAAVTGDNAADSMYTMGYLNNPWEYWAYETNNPEARRNDEKATWLLF